MKTIEIFDTTLRDGEQSPGAAMSPKARQRIATMLAHAGVDTIEAGFPAASPLVATSIASIARRVRTPRIAALARCTTGDIDAAAQALHGAARPRIHVFLATSDIHLQHKLRISKERALEMTREAVAYARRFCDDVEFSAEDATRTDPEFLARVFSAALDAGAGTLNIPDTVGYAMPEEMTRLVRYVFEHCEGIRNAVVSVHTHDDLGLAVANALAAVASGAGQVECTINGIGERAGNAALEEVVVALRTRSAYFGAQAAFDASMLQMLSRTVAHATRMPVQKNKAVVGKNAFAHESGIHQDGVLKERTTYEIIDPGSVGAASALPLGRHSGRHALFERARRLGLEFGDAQARKIFFERFSAFAQERRRVYDADLVRLAESSRKEVVVTGT
jgi:2-isopropylmalate synthase